MNQGNDHPGNNQGQQHQEVNHPSSGELGDVDLSSGGSARARTREAGVVEGIARRQGDDQYPKFETYREQIDGKYWFPTYTKAQDTLQFSSGAQRMRQVIKYENYKKFEADVKLTFGVCEK